MRAIWGGLVAVVSTFLFSLGMLPLGLFTRYSSLQALGVRNWSKSILYGSGIRLTIQGAENAAGGPYVIIANHASMLDINACAAAIPINLRFVSRPFFFKIPLLGWSMAVSGHVSLDPRNPREASAVLARLGDGIRHGISYLLFPEGTRSKDGTIQRYRRGPFRTAIREQVPVLPVRVQGTEKCLPKGSLAIRRGAIKVIIGAPVPTDGLTDADARDLAKRIEDWARAQDDGPASPQS